LRTISRVRVTERYVALYTPDNNLSFVVTKNERERVRVVPTRGREDLVKLGCCKLVFQGFGGSDFVQRLFWS
jgi:hypothetical protein